VNTREIDRFIRSDDACRGIFQGVFNIDTLPEKPRLLVCDSYPSNRPGNHWIALFVDSTGRTEYFNSFGQPPFNVFKDYMNKHCTGWILNTKQLQGFVSSYCGFYYCFYCMLRCRSSDLTRIVYLFGRDTGVNDSVVNSFACDILWLGSRPKLRNLPQAEPSFRSARQVFQRLIARDYWEC
jgi:hypothetical protein